MVEVVIVWGVGVAGLSILSHTHTPRTVDFTMEKETTAITPAGYHSLHDIAVAHALPFSRPLHRLFIFMQGIVVHSHARDFLVLPPQTSPLRICGWAAVSSPCRLILGAATFLPCECCSLLCD